MDSKSSDGCDDSIALGNLFETGLSLHSSLEYSSEPTNSCGFQYKVKKAVGLLEDATKIVSVLGIFSSNEDLEEVATSDLKFFLLPALLGSLTTKLTEVNRGEVLKVAQIYFEDFLTRCKSYGLTDIAMPSRERHSPDVSAQQDTSNNQMRSVIEMSRKRIEQIRRFTETKEMEKKLSELKKHIERDSADEFQRDYYITLIKWWICKAFEELDSITLENKVLEHKASLKSNSPELTRRKDGEPPKPLKPVIITKNEVQKKVFGMGYPGLPTMTVDEFYEQKVKEGTFAVPDMSLQAIAQGELNKQLQKENDDTENETKIETDDPTALKHSRDFDDWKDDHRRGWGNRQNMG